MLSESFICPLNCYFSILCNLPRCVYIDSIFDPICCPIHPWVCNQFLLVNCPMRVFVFLQGPNACCLPHEYCTSCGIFHGPRVASLPSSGVPLELIWLVVWWWELVCSLLAHTHEFLVDTIWFCCEAYVLALSTPVKILLKFSKNFYPTFLNSVRLTFNQ